MNPTDLFFKLVGNKREQERAPVDALPELQKQFDHDAQWLADIDKRTVPQVVFAVDAAIARGATKCGE